MIIMYRYMIGDTLSGGCVLAENEEEAKAKVRPYYADEYGADIEISIWIDDELSADVVHFY